jgi:hypothetical protein
MLYHTLTENQMPFTCPCACTDAQHKVYGRGAILRKVSYITLKLSFENVS